MRTIRRVLVVHPYGIGDFLFVTPVLRALRLLPTVEKVDLLLGSRTREVASVNPHVDEIFVVDKDKQHRQSGFDNFKEWAILCRRLRANHYDLMIDYSMRREYAFLGAWILGIRKRAGFDYKGRGCFHNVRLAVPEGFKDHHVVEDYAHLAEKAGVPVEHRELEFYLSREVRQEAESFIREKLAGKSFLAVAPGGGESWGRDARLKQWPVRTFSDLIHSLHSRVSFDKVLILGSPGEKTLCDELAKLLKAPSIVMAGTAGIGLAAALMERSVLFLGNDGGLVHMAHALRVPLVAFYGPVAAETYGPYPARETSQVFFKKDLSCRPCYRKFRYRSNCETRECLEALSAEEVVRGLEEKAFFKHFAKASKGEYRE